MKPRILSTSPLLLLAFLLLFTACPQKTNSETTESDDAQLSSEVEGKVSVGFAREPIFSGEFFREEAVYFREVEASELPPYPLRESHSRHFFDRRVYQDIEADQIIPQESFMPPEE